MKHLVIIVLFLGISFHGYSQIRKNLEIGFNRGAQITRSYPSLKSGIIAKAGVFFEVNKNLLIGPGTGYLILETEEFTPLYIDFLIMKEKKHGNPYISTKMGYSKGWSDEFRLLSTYKFNGGVFFSPGIGYKVIISESLSFLMNVNYIYQSVNIEYLGPIRYDAKSHIDLINFNIGVLL